MGANPFLTIRSEKNKIILEEDGQIKKIDGNPLDILQEKLNLYKIQREEIPFVGGAVGF